MKWKIDWDCGELDELPSVYAKAEADDYVSGLLRDLEDLTLAEARRYCAEASDLRFDALNEREKVHSIFFLANLGLSGSVADAKEAVIAVRLSGVVQSVFGCTIFLLLNMLEDLDGTFDRVIGKLGHEKATLLLQVPAAGREGLFQNGMMLWEMLIFKLYPWIQISVVSTNDPVAELAFQRSSKNGPAGDPASDRPAQAGNKNYYVPRAAPKRERKGLFPDLFGKKDQSQ